VARTGVLVLGPAVGALMMLLSGAELYARASLSIEGTVESANSGCLEPVHSRCATTYLVRTVKGSDMRYHAGPVDEDLRRDLPVGSIVDKERWRFSYTVNGHQIDDYPFYVYSGAFLAGLIIFSGSYSPELSAWWTRRRKSARVASKESSK
jgi:hypothetical protein